MKKILTVFLLVSCLVGLLSAQTVERTAHPIPYIQDFESATNLADIGWLGNMNITTNHGTNGSKGLTRNIYGTSTNQTGQAFSNPIGPVTAETMLQFDYRLVNYTSFPNVATPIIEGDKVEVLISSDNVNFVSLYEINHTNHTVSTDFANISLSLASYSGSIIYVKFDLFRAAGDYYVNIDNFMVRELPTTPVFVINPTEKDFGTHAILSTMNENFTISNTGIGELIISELSIEGSTAFSINNLAQLPLVINSDEPAIVTVIFNPTTIGEHLATLLITDNTNRTVHQVALSGDATDPIIYELPYTESFEDGNSHNSIIINDWTQIIAPGTWTQSWTVNSTETTYNRIPRTGSYNLTLRYSGNSWIFRPVQLTAGTSYDIELYARQDGAVATNANIGIYYGNAATIEAMTNTIKEQTGLINGDYQRMAGSFIPEESGIYYIGIQGWINGTPWYISLDDITITHSPDIPTFSITPNSHSFGTTLVGTTSTQVFTMNNIGAGDLIINDINISGDSYFTLTNIDELPIVISGTNTSTFTVNYTPTNEEEHSATVTIIDNTGRETHTVIVGGSGFIPPIGSTCENPYLVTLPLVDYQDNTETYGNNYTSAMINPASNYLNGYDFVTQFVLTENSLFTGSVTGSYTGLFIVSEEPNTVNPVERIGFAGTASGGTITNLPLAAGTYFAIVSTWPAPNFTDFTLNMSATPQPTIPEFSITPSEKNFGYVAINTTATQLFTITNTGGGSLDISSLNVEGSDSFTITGLTELPISLGYNQSTTFTINYTPTTVETHTANIIIVDNTTRNLFESRSLNSKRSSRESHTVLLTGEGLSPVVSNFPYLQTFDTFPPLFWTRTKGLLAETTETTGTTSSWVADGFANDGTTGATRLNIYGTNVKEWLITPSIDLGNEGLNYILSFDLALTDYNNQDPITEDPEGTTGIDDKFAVLISTDNGETWSSNNILALWDNNEETDSFVYNNISHTGQNISMNLIGYSGLVKIAFYGESTLSNADNDLHLDNISITISEDEPTFNAPQNLTAVSGNASVSLSWQAPNRNLSGYKVYRNGTAITEVITNLNFTDTELVNGTEYTYYVTAIYSSPDGESDPSNTVTATPFAPVFNPPANLTAHSGDASVVLSWQAPAQRNESLVALSTSRNSSRTLTGYKVYRNGTAISNTITTLTYTDNTALNGTTYNYYVTAIYSNPDGESEPSNTVTATPMPPVPFPPAGFTGVNTVNTEVELNWETPAPEDTWISQANSTLINTGIQTQAPATVTVAHRFTNEQLLLEGIYGHQLTKVSFIPVHASHTYTIKVWRGGTSATNPGTLVSQQDVTNITPNFWNDVILDTPVDIIYGQSIWYGYTVTTTTTSTVLGVVDAGPAFEGYGNLVHLNDAWTTLLVASSNELNYNWLLRAFLETGETTRTIGSEFSLTDNTTSSMIDLSSLSAVSLDYELPPMSIRSRNDYILTGFNLYRNGTLLTTIEPNLRTYTDIPEEPNFYNYGLTAVYGDVETRPKTVRVKAGEKIISQFPWTYDFENLGFPEFDWYLVDNDGDGINWMVLDVQGNRSLVSFSYLEEEGALNPDNWVIIPAVQVPSDQQVFFSYDVSAIVPDAFNEHYAVMISTTDRELDSFSVLFEETMQTPMTYRRSLDLTSYQGQKVYLALRHYDVSDQYVIIIDNLEFSTTSNENDETVPVVTTGLLGNYPNPFNPETVINYNLANDNNISIEVFNIRGQKVKTLIDAYQKSGSHSIVWNGKDDNGRQVGSGMYFYKMRSGSYTSTRKMILMK